MGVSSNETSHTPSPQTAIGIDFGSSKCCVGLVRDGKVEILENERGSKTTPSFVAFTEAERLVGESARDQAALNPTNTVLGVKRLLGRKCVSREMLVELARYLPYGVTQENGIVKIKISYKGKEKKLSPEQIASMLLSRMKKLAEKHLDSPVRKAVIAVPAHFTNAQRRALIDAGTIAGLTILGLISETTAAAMAYQDGKTFAKKQNVLVVDIGGGAFNAAAVEVQDASVEVKAIGGTPELSGGELDRVLVEHLADRFAKLNKVDVKENQKAFVRLKIACQKAKHTLTLLPETVVQVDCLVGETDFSDTIKRTELNEKFLPAAQKTIENVLCNVLRDAKLTRPMIDEILLIGGTTRVPAVQEALVKFFAGKLLNKTVNPDEAVAHGAALQAAILVKNNSISELWMTDIVANPVVVPKYIRKCRRWRWLEIPKHGEEYSLYYDWYPSKTDKFREKIHHFLDSFGVYMPKCTPAVIEKVKISHVNVKLIRRYLTDGEVTSMTREVQEFDQEDEEYRQLICAVSDLEALCFSVKSKLTPEGGEKGVVNSDVSPRLKALDFCDETLDWLDVNELSSKEDYENKLTKLRGLLVAVEKKRMNCQERDLTKKVEHKNEAKISVKLDSNCLTKSIVEAPRAIQETIFAGKGCKVFHKVDSPNDNSKKSIGRERHISNCFIDRGTENYETQEIIPVMIESVQREAEVTDVVKQTGSNTEISATQLKSSELMTRIDDPALHQSGSIKLTHACTNYAKDDPVINEISLFDSLSTSDKEGADNKVDPIAELVKSLNNCQLDSGHPIHCKGSDQEQFGMASHGDQVDSRSEMAGPEDQSDIRHLETLSIPKEADESHLTGTQTIHDDETRPHEQLTSFSNGSVSMEVDVGCTGCNETTMEVDVLLENSYETSTNHQENLGSGNVVGYSTHSGGHSAPFCQQHPELEQHCLLDANGQGNTRQCGARIRCNDTYPRHSIYLGQPPPLPHHPGTNGASNTRQNTVHAVPAPQEGLPNNTVYSTVVPGAVPPNYQLQLWFDILTKTVENYIYETDSIMHMYDPRSSCLPLYPCFYCFCSHAPLQVYRELKEIFSQRTGCLPPACAYHDPINYPSR